MGMYDYVNVEVDCPSCGVKLTGFQSKSGNCLLELLQADDVDCFYSFCTCGTEVIFRRPPKEWEPKQKLPPDDLQKVYSLGFTMETTTKEGRNLKYKEFQDRFANSKGEISFPFTDKN